jgi:hypothetical protein
MLFEGIAWLSQRGGAGLDPMVRELALLTTLACLGLGLAWAYEADYFAMVQRQPSLGSRRFDDPCNPRPRPASSNQPTVAIRVARTKIGTRASEPLQSWRARPCGSTTRASAAFGY